MCLEFIVRADCGSQFYVVVDLSIDGEDEFPVLAHQGLSAGVCMSRKRIVKYLRAGPEHQLLADTDDGQTFVNEARLFPDVAPGPIWTAMALLLGQSDETSPVDGGFFKTMYGKDSAHLGLGESVVNRQARPALLFNSCSMTRK